MIRAARHLAAKLLVVILGRISRVSRPLAFRLTDLVAACTTFARRGPTTRDVARLFPELDPSRRRSVIRNAWRTQARHFLLEALVLRNGIAAIQPLLRQSDALDALRGPATLVTFHTGPLLALVAAAERVNGPVFGIRSSEVRTARIASVKVRRPGDSVESRTAIIVDAVRHLRTGGFVLVAADGQHSSTLPVPFLNTHLRLSRGAFSPARMTRTPVVPILARWVDREMELVIGEPLAGDDEEALAASAARWLESYLRVNPEELSQRFIDLQEVLPS